MAVRNLEVLCGTGQHFRAGAIRATSAALGMDSQGAE